MEGKINSSLLAVLSFICQLDSQEEMSGGLILEFSEESLVL